MQHLEVSGAVRRLYRSLGVKGLIFTFIMSSTCFEPEGSSSGRRLYIQVWYRVFYMLKLKLKALIRYLSTKYLEYFVLRYVLC